MKIHLCRLAVAFGLSAPFTGEAADAGAPDRVRLLTSHVDIRVLYQPADETNKLAVVVRDDDRGHTYLSNEVALVAVEAARLTLPPGTIFGEEGDPFWVPPKAIIPNFCTLACRGNLSPAAPSPETWICACLRSAVRGIASCGRPARLASSTSG